MLSVIGIISACLGFVFIGPFSSDQNEEDDQISDSSNKESGNTPDLLNLGDPVEVTNQTIQVLREAAADGEDESIFGGLARDLLQGTEVDDIVSGLQGDDWISSSDGNDLVFGGSGFDSINAGDGHDIVYGEDGSDVIEAGHGDDEVYGGLGKDTLHGQEGNDVLFGGNDEEPDILIGGDGDDRIFANYNDRLILGNGDDVVITELGMAVEVFDFNAEEDTLCLVCPDAQHQTDINLIDTDAGLQVRLGEQIVVTLAGLTTFSNVNIVFEEM